MNAQLHVRVKSCDDPSLDSLELVVAGNSNKPVIGAECNSEYIKSSLPRLLALLASSDAVDGCWSKSELETHIPELQKLVGALRKSPFSKFGSSLGWRNENQLKDETQQFFGSQELPHVWSTVVSVERHSLSFQNCLLNKDSVKFSSANEGEKELSSSEVVSRITKHDYFPVVNNSIHKAKNSISTTSVFSDCTRAYARAQELVDSLPDDQITKAVLVQYSGMNATELLERLVLKNCGVDLYLVRAKGAHSGQGERIKFFQDHSLQQIRGLTGARGSIDIYRYPASLMGPRLVWVPGVFAVISSYRQVPSRSAGGKGASPIFAHMDPATLVTQSDPEFKGVSAYIESVVGELGQS